MVIFSKTTTDRKWLEIDQYRFFLNFFFKILTSGNSTYSTPCWAVAFGSMVQIFSFPFRNRPSVGTNVKLNGLPNAFKCKFVRLLSNVLLLYGLFVCFNTSSLLCIVFCESFEWLFDMLLFRTCCIGTNSYSGTEIQKKCAV